MVRSYLHPWSNAQSDRWWSALGSWNNPHRMSSPTSLRSCRGGRKEGERKKDHPGCNSPNHRKTKQTANLQQQEMKLLPFAWPSPSHPRPASHIAAVSNEWGSPLSLLPSRQPSWQHFAVVKSWCCSPDLGARRLIRSLLPARFTQKAAEPTAAHHIDRGCHQSSCSGAQTHHTPKVIHISIFLSKQKGSWGASFNLFNLMEGKGATSIGRLDAFLTPVTAYCKYTGEKDTSANKNICKIPCLSAGCPQLHQSSRCCILWLSCSPSIPVSLSCSEVGSLRLGCPEGANLRTAKPTRSSAPGEWSEEPSRALQGPSTTPLLPKGGRCAACFCSPDNAAVCGVWRRGSTVGRWRHGEGRRQRLCGAEAIHVAGHGHVGAHHGN